jgi:hypothetical protein
VRWKPAATVHSVAPGRHPAGSAGRWGGFRRTLPTYGRGHPRTSKVLQPGGVLQSGGDPFRCTNLRNRRFVQGDGPRREHDASRSKDRGREGAKGRRLRNAGRARRTAPQVPPPHRDHRPIRCTAHARIDCRGQSLDLTGIIPGSRYPASSCGRASPRTATTGGCDRRTVLCPATTASTHGACSPR